MQPKIKKMFILIISIAILLVHSNIVLAQNGEIEISKLETQIMPEYDTTDILIVNAIELRNKSAKEYSGDLKWRIPKGAIKHIVSDKQMDKHLQFNILNSKGYDEIVWKMPAPIKPGEVKNIHLEFYYNNLQGNPDKQFNYQLAQSYPILTAQLIMVQPIKAINFKITPDFGQPQSNQGFTFYIKSINNLAAEENLKISATYSKSDPNPSILPGQQQVQNQNVQATESNSNSNSNLMIFLLAGAAILIVIMITIKITSNNNNEEEYFEDDNYDHVYDDEEYLDKPKKKRTNNINSEKINKIKWLEAEKKKLRKKLENALITEVDYYEAVIELEEEAGEKFGL